MASEETPKLRMASPEPMEATAQRIEREKRSSNLQRESNLEHSLAPFRVGSVGYLNAVPLTRGLEEEVLFATPSKLAELLRVDQLDAGLVSVVEVLFTDRYDILDSIAIASLGEVKSVLLAHRRPLEEASEIYCDAASLTSVELLRVLLAERGVKPDFKPLESYDFKALPDYALLIGDRALDLLLGPHEHQIWDLGAAWYELTGLPFVYAVWALRRGIENSALKRHLREARDFGLDTLDSIIRTRSEYTLDFRQDYLGWHIHFHLGTDEKRGLQKFIELLRKHTDRKVYEPRFVV
ncbi:MAG TPA: menaquinone biosynthesis protein [Verrucomicrobiae bacterium]|nr:menaquinone biosynthesis protein [Verrucomicrobiae bacterium]